jgi:hypothetical protein
MEPKAQCSGRRRACIGYVYLSLAKPLYYRLFSDEIQLNVNPFSFSPWKMVALTKIEHFVSRWLNPEIQ